MDLHLHLHILSARCTWFLQHVSHNKNPAYSASVWWISIPLIGSDKTPYCSCCKGMPGTKKQKNTVYKMCEENVDVESARICTAHRTIACISNFQHLPTRVIAYIKNNQPPIWRPCSVSTVGLVPSRSCSVTQLQNLSWTEWSVDLGFYLALGAGHAEYL